MKITTPSSANTPWLLSAIFGLTISGTVCADSTSSDPASLPRHTSENWMEGFPPPPDRIIRNGDRDFFASPKLDWTVCHLRELLPTKNVNRGIGAPVPLEPDLDSDIDSITFKRSDNGETMPWGESYKVNHTDGLLVLHNGKVVYERYSGCLDNLGKHAVMSVSKSVLGIIAESLIVEGVIDESALAGDLIPELKGSAFEKATVREILNMTTSLKFNEDYADSDADIWKYGAATTALPKPASYEGPRSYFEYLQGVKADGEHGKAFDYKTINPDVIG